jgi:hypothetical protein
LLNLLDAGEAVMSNLSGYGDERKRRLEQFDRYLRLMVERRRCERHLDCGIIFSEDPPDNLRPDTLEEVARLPAGRREHRWPFHSFEQWQEEVRDWNPVQKEYPSSDTRAAAEDMAYVFFDLWRFPPEAPLYYQVAFFFACQTKLGRYEIARLAWAGMINRM